MIAWPSSNLTPSKQGLLMINRLKPLLFESLLFDYIFKYIIIKINKTGINYSIRIRKVVICEL